MDEGTTPEPIESESWLGSPTTNDPALDALVRLPILARLFVTLFMVLVAVVVGLLGILVSSIDHWAAWVFVVGIAEPLAVFLVLGALYCLVPASALGRVLLFVYRRAKIAVWVVMSAAALATVAILALTGWNWLTGSL